MSGPLTNKQLRQLMPKGEVSFMTEEAVHELLQAAARLGQQIELERIVKEFDVSVAELKLRCGEMTAQELRTVQAVLKWIVGALRSEP